MQRLNLITLFIIFVTLTACGGGGGGGTTTPTPASSKSSNEVSSAASSSSLAFSSTPTSSSAAASSTAFQEGKIEVAGKLSGMSYATATQSGKVDNLGFITANQGDTVQFSLGEKELGSIVISTDFITPANILGVNEDTGSTDVALQNLQAMFLSLDSDKNPDNGISLPNTISNIPADLDLTSGNSMAAAVLAVDPGVTSVDPAAAEIFFKNSAEILGQKYTKIGNYEAHYVFDDYTNNANNCTVYTSATMTISDTGNAKHYEGTLFTNNTPIDQFSAVPNIDGEIVTNKGRKLKYFSGSRNISIWDGSAIAKECRVAIGMRNINALNTAPSIGSVGLSFPGDNLDSLPHCRPNGTLPGANARGRFHITTTAYDNDGHLTSAILKIYRNGQLTDTLNLLAELSHSGDRPGVTRSYENDIGARLQLVTGYPLWDDEQVTVPYQIAKVFFNVSCFETVQYTIELKDERGGVSNFSSEVFEAAVDGEPKNIEGMQGRFISKFDYPISFYSLNNTNTYSEWCDYDRLELNLSRHADNYTLEYVASDLTPNNGNSTQCPASIQSSFSVHVDWEYKGESLYQAKTTGTTTTPIFGGNTEVSCLFNDNPADRNLTIAIGCYSLNVSETSGLNITAYFPEN